MSLVLFTHEVALRPLAEDLVRDAMAATTTTTLQEFSALGLRALARAADWRLTNALSEMAEAVLQVSELPFSDLHRAVRLPRGDAPIGSCIRPRAQSRAYVSSARLPHDRSGARER